MPGEVGFIAHQMLPVPSLPDFTFAFVDAAGTSMFAEW